MAVERDLILVVDDDEGLRTLVSSLLERTGYETVEAATGAQALEAARRSRPALVVLDVDLPEISGYEVCRELREQFGHDLPIVFLSGVRMEPYDRVGGLLIGGDDYLVKPFDGDELIARVRRLIPRRRDRSSGDYELTRRELEILTMLATGHAQSEIAHELVISPKTVATHIQRILAKLGVRNRTQAVVIAHRDGLIASRASTNGNGLRS